MNTTYTEQVNYCVSRYLKLISIHAPKFILDNEKSNIERKLMYAVWYDNVSQEYINTVCKIIE